MNQGIYQSGYHKKTTHMDCLIPLQMVAAIVAKYNKNYGKCRTISEVGDIIFKDDNQIKIIFEDIIYDGTAWGIIDWEYNI